MSLNINLGLTAVAGGTVDVITATYSPAPSSLYDRLILFFRASGANTIAGVTFNPNALGAKTIVKRGGQALIAGDIPRALYECIVMYDAANTRWELLNPGGFGTNAETPCAGNDSRLLENKRNDYVDHLTFNPVAAATYFFGGEFNVTPVVSDTDQKRIYVRTTAPLVLKKADYSRISGLSTGPSTINVYVRLNNTTDYLIGTVDTSVGLIEHISNVAMAVPFVDGDFYTIKLVMPAFVTPPASYRSFATLYFER